MKNVIDWFSIWHDDKNSMLETMWKNLAADLACGYNPCGPCVMQQRHDIATYASEFDEQMRKLADMGERKANRWCYMDLLRRGAISAA